MKAIYIARPLLSPLADLEDLRQKFRLAPKRDKAHVTLVYSEAAVNWAKDVFQPLRDQLRVSHPYCEVMTLGDHVALKFTSAALIERFEALTAAGAKVNFENFQPHVTLGTVTAETPELPKTVTLSEPLAFGPEERDDRPEKKAAIARAALAFANDYGPLPAANAGDIMARERIADRLVEKLKRQGLKITLH